MTRNVINSMRNPLLSSLIRYFDFFTRVQKYTFNLLILRLTLHFLNQ
jgi:hypothetical protein